MCVRILIFGIIFRLGSRPRRFGTPHFSMWFDKLFKVVHLFWGIISRLGPSSPRAVWHWRVISRSNSLHVETSQSWCFYYVHLEEVYFRRREKGRLIIIRQEISLPMFRPLRSADFFIVSQDGDTIMPNIQKVMGFMKSLAISFKDRIDHKSSSWDLCCADSQISVIGILYHRLYQSRNC